MDFLPAGSGPGGRSCKSTRPDQSFYNHQLIERETSWHMTRRLLVQIKSRGVLGRAAPRSRHFRMYSQNRAERVDQ
jgi:hypothetical protein